MTAANESSGQSHQSVTNFRVAEREVALTSPTAASKSSIPSASELLSLSLCFSFLGVLELIIPSSPSSPSLLSPSKFEVECECECECDRSSLSESSSVTEPSRVDA
jgi:hypothetical protein